MRHIKTVREWENGMIDKEMFPTEYAAIERLKERSRQIERGLSRKRETKLAMVEECRRRLHEQEYSERRDR